MAYEGTMYTIIRSQLFIHSSESTLVFFFFLWPLHSHYRNFTTGFKINIVSKCYFFLWQATGIEGERHSLKTCEITAGSDGWSNTAQAHKWIFMWRSILLQHFQPEATAYQSRRKREPVVYFGFVSHIFSSFKRRREINICQGQSHPPTSCDWAAGWERGKGSSIKCAYLNRICARHDVLVPY